MEKHHVRRDPAGSNDKLPLRPLEKSHDAASGNTLLGPIASGAVARATITLMVPMICAKASVAQTCSRERV